MLATKICQNLFKNECLCLSITWFKGLNQFLFTLSWRYRVVACGHLRDKERGFWKTPLGWLIRSSFIERARARQLLSMEYRWCVVRVVTGCRFRFPPERQIHKAVATLVPWAETCSLDTLHCGTFSTFFPVLAWISQGHCRKGAKKVQVWTFLTP